MTPEEWLAGFEAKIAEVQQKAAEFKENLEAAGATEANADGTLRVTVAPNGALTDLTIDDAALRGNGGELAGQIMRLARKAQRAAAAHVVEAFAPLAGEDSESLRMVTGYRPPEEEDEEPEPDEGQGYTFTGTLAGEQPDPEPPAPPVEPPGRPNRPRSSTHDDDEDFGNEQIFGRRDDEW
ncbi:MAG: YbaB/EbfC family nucleoid-associated protein [Labedaea sp.]